MKEWNIMTEELYIERKVRKKESELIEVNYYRLEKKGS